MVSGGRVGQEDNADHHHLEATLPVRILMLTLPAIGKQLAPYLLYAKSNAQPINEKKVNGKE
ncbi:hypothetical protein NC652_001223 [Populus alba x Populus x berolinensis]|nr:hypothetical protein NC652_001223 [Populus alba x Populus x berolinensis]